MIAGQVQRSELVELSLAIDEGLRFTISGSVINSGAALWVVLNDDEDVECVAGS